MNTYRGFSLFTEVEDAQLRRYNQGRILANIAIDHSKDGRVTAKGAGIILGYFSQIKKDERDSVKEQFKQFMEKEGYALVG